MNTAARIVSALALAILLLNFVFEQGSMQNIALMEHLDGRTLSIRNSGFHQDNRDESARESEEEASESNTKKQYLPMKLDLKGAAAADRDLDGIIVDLHYKLKVPIDWWDNANVSPRFDELMGELHGKNVWNDPGLQGNINYLGLEDPRKANGGSPLNRELLIDLLQKAKQPRIFLEVGVFHGMTSTFVAKYFKANKGFEESYVISMDSWLLDLRFVWSGVNSANRELVKKGRYFTNNKDIGGGQTMYYHFASNCIRSNTTDRIIPIQSSSQNGAMALLAHGVRPDMMYIDASHSLPDIFIDLENFYKILIPGGWMAVDDILIPSVKSAFEALEARYNLDVKRVGGQAYFFKRETPW